jgi:hypothetical protein
MQRFALVSLAAFALAGFVPAQAQEAVVTGESKGTPYASGGVGLDSREELTAKQKDYDLMVVVSLTDGRYLGGAAVVVRNQAGKVVLEVDSQGPWLLAKLPPGRYTVEGTVGNVTHSKRVIVRTKAVAHVHLVWEAKSVRDET